MYPLHLKQSFPLMIGTCTHWMKVRYLYKYFVSFSILIVTVIDLF